MSLVRTLRRFIGTRAASTVNAPQPTPATPTPPPALTLEELRMKAKRVYKEVSTLGMPFATVGLLCATRRCQPVLQSVLTVSAS